MGKGDRKTKRGKIHLGTSGSRRKKKKKKATTQKTTAKKAAKTKKTPKAKS